MIGSIETVVGLGLHVLSDHFGGIAGVHYKVNSLLIPLHLQVLHVHTLHKCPTTRPVCSYLAWILCFEILF